MSRIIPGVQVTVVKDVVPPQLAPSGVLGVIGITETVPEATERASSWSRFVEIFGPASTYSMPEARQAIQNGVFELVICPLSKDAGVRSTVEIKGAGKKRSFILEARAPGPWANGLQIKIEKRGSDLFDLSVQIPETTDYEIHRNISIKSSIDGADNPAYVETVINNRSSVVRVKEKSVSESVQPEGANPYLLSGGVDAGTGDYVQMLQELKNEPDVDMVLASVQDLKSEEEKAKTATKEKAAKIHSEIISHCNNMSEDSKGRIGFGQIPAGTTPDEASDMVNSTISDRFVLVAPHGVAGAVAGMIGSLNYYQSPTFKNVSGLGAFQSGFGIEDQRKLLKAHVVPIINERGRGTILLRGLTTDGDQINVRRIADRAVRGVKLIGEGFIGRLNTEDGRGALKQKLIEFLTQMEKDNAIVPSTDGTDPAFKVDVYSSQADFAKGIVRIDMAVRPVRAIDFIYATIQVQV